MWQITLKRQQMHSRQMQRNTATHVEAKEAFDLSAGHSSREVGAAAHPADAIQQRRHRLRIARHAHLCGHSTAAKRIRGLHQHPTV